MNTHVVDMAQELHVHLMMDRQGPEQRAWRHKFKSKMDKQELKAKISKLCLRSNTWTR